MEISSIRPSEHRDVLSGLVEMAQSIEASIETLRAMKHNLLEGLKEFPLEQQAPAAASGTAVRRPRGKTAAAEAAE